MNIRESSSRVAGRLAVFSTLTAMCALLAEYILVQKFQVSYLGFLGFLVMTAACLWLSFFSFARYYQAEWFDQVTDRNKELQLQAQFSSLNPWPVLRFDRYGQLISKNSNAKTFFYKAEFEGQHQRSVFDFFPEITKEVWRELVSQETPLELEHNRSGFWLCFYFRTHLQSGVINVYGYDVTRFKRQQQQSAQMLTLANQNVLKTQQLLHDTFAGLHGPARALADEFPTELYLPGNLNQHSMNPKIIKDIIAMVEVVSRLEEIAELDPSQFHTQQHSFDCRFIFEQLITQAGKCAYEQGGEVILDCDFASHDVVLTDGRRLQQALEAVLRFALARSRNGVSLIKARCINDVGLSLEYSAETQRRVLRISVHDSGNLDDKVMNFLSATYPAVLEIQGVDLNIRFLSALLPLVGGTVQVEASALGGHGITFDWPVAVSKSHQAPSEKLPLSHLHVFVLDQSLLSGEAIAKTLSRAGASVEYGTHAHGWIERLRANPPDVLMYAEHRGAKVDEELLAQFKSLQDKPLALCLLVHQGTDLNTVEFNHLQVESIVLKPVRQRLLIQGVEQAWNSACRAFVNANRVGDLEQLESQQLSALRKLSSTTLQSVVPASHSKVPSILVIDDDMVVLHLVSDLLTEIGVDVEVAGNAELGLKYLARFAFDLVIIDVRMPNMSGFEAAQEIRSNYGDTLPILALTASDEPEDRVKALQIGMNDYLVKPVDRTVLIERLCRWVHLPGLDQNNFASESLPILDDSAPLIQVQDAIRLFSQNVSIFIRSLLRFYGRFAFEPKLLAALVEKKESDKIIQRLHVLRSGAANIGAYQLRDSIFSVEKTLRQVGITPESTLATQELIHLFERVMGEASKLLQDYTASHAVSEELNQAPLAKQKYSG